MKKILFTAALLTAFSLELNADVTEVMNTKVSFQKFGTLSQKTTTTYKNVLKKDDNETNFDSSGFWGKVVSKFFQKGKTGSIYNLPEKNIYNVNYDNSTYSVSKIEKLNLEKEKTAKEEKAEPAENRYKIIRNELKVTDTGNKKTINGFDTKEFQITYILETEDLASKTVKTDSMFVSLFTSDNKDIFDKSSKEKEAFNTEFSKLMGLEDFHNQLDEKILGLQWLKIMNSMDVKSQNNESQIDYSQLKKISGYPIVIDGHFFTKTFDPNKKAEETAAEDNSPAVPTSLGGLLSKAKKKVVKEPPKPAGGFNETLSYYIETVSIKFDSLTDTDFNVPAGFKEKK